MSADAQMWEFRNKASFFHHEMITTFARLCSSTMYGLNTVVFVQVQTHCFSRQVLRQRWPESSSVFEAQSLKNSERP